MRLNRLRGWVWKQIEVMLYDVCCAVPQTFATVCAAIGQAVTLCNGSHAYRVSLVVQANMSCLELIAGSTVPYNSLSALPSRPRRACMLRRRRR
jgi:hypothetical protein